MSIVSWVTRTTLTVLLSISCGADPSDKPARISSDGAGSRGLSDKTRSAQIYRGYAVHGHEVRSFRPCESADALWVTGPADLLWKLHKELTPNRSPYEEVFTVVEGIALPAPTDGFGADYPGAIQIDRVLYVGLEGPDCRQDWSAFHYRASGNEPFWSAEVSDRRLRLSRMGSEDQLWHGITAVHTINGVRYGSADPTSIPVELTVSRQPSRDSMSGAYFAFTSVLRVGDVVLRGCALQGRPSSAR
jgi:uncharacterized membrane protein